MADTIVEQTSSERLERLQAALDRGASRTVRGMLNDLYPSEIATLIESLPRAERLVVFRLIDDEASGEVLLEVGDEVRTGLIERLDDDALLVAAEELELDDLADILEDLPDLVIKKLLTSMDADDRARLEAVLGYPEDSAGGLMNTDTVTVRRDVTLDVVLRYLRMRAHIPALTDVLFVVNRRGQYQGVLPLSLLLITDDTKTVREVMDADVDAINANLPDIEVARHFEARDLLTAPVVDDNNVLVGRITVDDVVDVIREEAEHSILAQAGLDEEDDMFAPVISSARKRAVWLGINLFTAFLASWVVGLFEATLDQVVALAVLMPVVASMGGIAGSQTLTLMIRGLALGNINRRNQNQLLRKELAVAAFNGVFWSIVVAAVATLWFKDVRIGFVIAIALIINQLCAALAGVIIPLALKRFGIDPALAGSVILTTITDIIGFSAFLGLGAIVLL